ncbi:MAG: penicillin-binding protein 1A [Rhodospirillaceae bacterium]
MFRLISMILSLMVIAGITGGAGLLYVLYIYGQDLPDYRQLANYEPPVMTRVHAGDGRLLAEYAKQKRVFVPIEAYPRRVINAFLSAEDKTFYQHPGIDIPGVVAAMLRNVKNIGSSKRPVGASTITQQVAKNFLLTNEVSIERKIKEAILAFRIERAFTKDRILELYLNEIYLGQGSYGVAAAALNYFNKSMDELSVAEVAYLAALPKAPNNYHPIKKLQAAQARRDWVVNRMLEDGHVTDFEAKTAWTEPLRVSPRVEADHVAAEYFAEEVRRELFDHYGEDQLYSGGLSVRTTLDPKLQQIAEKALREGLESFDRRVRAWRGPLATVKGGPAVTSPGEWMAVLKGFTPPKGLEHHKIALVTAVDGRVAHIGLADGSAGKLPMTLMQWARRKIDDDTWAPKPKKPADVVVPGDIIAVSLEDRDDQGKPLPEGTYALRQLPEVQGGIVALDPHTGRVLAMVGGYSFHINQFNRVTQALRQPGSAIKPFVYLAALDEGFTPSTRILDAPFVVDQGPGLPKWRPGNYTNQFYGPSTMRLGIEKSRNLMTVRLAQTIGMEKVAKEIEEFGIVDHMPRSLSMALGAGETTLLKLTTAYAMLVNGGKRIQPTLIDRIQERKGRTVFRHDDRPCPGCRAAARTGGEAVPAVPDTRKQVADPGSAYQVVSMLEGVVKRGTGARIGQIINKPLAGKTGTTNKSRDTWFIGFSPDLAVGVFVGYDNPETLGRRETGSSVAAPIFSDFMKEALEGKPAIPFRIPPGIRLVRVDAKTGLPALVGQNEGVIWESFKPGTLPSTDTEVISAGQGMAGIVSGDTTSQPLGGTGGLY